jgi:deazaflavin-dependent oxidoreductase (nitroreductase family)
MFNSKGKGVKAMPEKIKDVRSPQGLARLFFRLPIWFYRMGLGSLLGNRFLLLTHQGRISSQERQTVLEVVRHDKEKTTFIVAAGFGPGSDWYRNIHKNPNVTVQSGKYHWKMIARFLTSEQAGEELLSYSLRYPLAWRELVHFMGYQLNGKAEDIRDMGKFIPMVEFDLE